MSGEGSLKHCHATSISVQVSWCADRYQPLRLCPRHHASSSEMPRPVRSSCTTSELKSSSSYVSPSAHVYDIIGGDSLGNLTAHFTKWITKEHALRAHQRLTIYKLLRRALGGCGVWGALVQFLQLARSHQGRAVLLLCLPGIPQVTSSSFGGKEAVQIWSCLRVASRASCSKRS